MKRATSRKGLWARKPRRVERRARGAGEEQVSPSEHDLRELMMWGVAAMAQSINPSAALRRILVLLTAKMWFVHAGVYASTGGGRAFQCVAQTKPAISANIEPFNHGRPAPFVEVARTRKAAYYPDASGLQGLAREVRIKSLYVVPLILRRRFYGVLSVHTYENNLIDDAGRALIDRFAALAALALERLELERDARGENVLMESILAQQELGVALASWDGTLRRVNAAFAQLLGCSPEELAGRRLENLVPEEEREKFLEAARALSRDAPRAGLARHRYRGNSGGEVWCETRFIRRGDAEGKRQGFLLVAADRSDLRQAEEARERMKNELLHSQKVQTLGLLAGGVAHDFNNALEVIMGFASLARLRMRAGDPLQEPLKIIEESAQGAAALARALLEAVRSDEGEAQAVDAAELLGSVVRITARTFDRKIRVEHHVETPVPCVQGLPGRLEQALMNLCLNARDAMPEGGRLTLAAAAEGFATGDPRLPTNCPAGSYVRLVVRDTGAGIPPEVQERMFDPLFTTKNSAQNAGLGLAMVDQIVKDAGGFITVSSAPSAGSEFVLHLPAVSAPALRPSKPLPMPLLQGRGTVLVVDDEPRVLDFLEKGLTRLGYKVLCAQSGKVACEMYSQQPQKVVCVLLDMIMPEMSGLETYAKLRDIDPQVKVILSSGYSSERVKREAAEAGGADFLGKPYTLETLSQALHKYRQN